MNTKEYVESLFKNYEESGSVKDFMEELQSNMDARIASLVKKGISAQEAFDRAKAELGDVSALADELSLEKRREVFEEVYMDIQNYMNAKRVAGYVVFGILAIFGIIAAAIVVFSTRDVFSVMGWEASFDLTGAFATVLPFFTAAVIGFTYLGVTQETASMYPVSKKRGAWYAAAAGLIIFGILLMPVVLFGSKFSGGSFEAAGAIAILVPFVLPGTGLLVYMILSEKNRLKPWAKVQHEEAMKQGMEMWSDPAGAARFGMYSGAVWIFAIALFILLGFIISFKYSWLVFLFATAIQLLVQALMMKKKA